ncbi:MAG: hypothetical protein IKB88_00620 [Clostridia bacterium]|nr:hypothetical protein [Clostridia bacterium]
MCNTLIKIASAIILFFAIILNFFGNLFGIGDIIPTEPKTTEETSISETVTEDLTSGDFITTEEPTTEESTTAETTTEKTTFQPMTRPSMPTATATTGASTPATRPATTVEIGMRVKSATLTDSVAFGGTNTDTYTGFAPLSDGGFVVSGVSNSTDGNLLNVPSDGWKKTGYGFVAKYNKNLELEWVNAVGSEEDGVRIEDVAVLSDGSIVAVGSSSAVDFASDKKYAGSLEGIIIRYSADGKETDRKFFGGSGSDVFKCIAPIGDGFVVGGGTTSVNGDFADSGDSTKTKALIISFDAEGNRIWNRYLSGNYGASVNGVATDEKGNIFITTVTSATTGGFAAIEGLGKGFVDTAVIKYNSSGEIQWTAAVSGAGRENFDSVTADGRGGCVVAGYYELVNTYEPDGTLEGMYACGGIDAVAIKFNSNGTIRWRRSIAGVGDDFISDVISVDNGFAVVGYTNSSNRDFSKCGNKGEIDSFVALITPEGNLADVKSLGGARKEKSACVGYTSDKKLIVLSQTTSSDGDFDGMNTHISDVLINILGDIYTGHISKYKISVSY